MTEGNYLSSITGRVGAGKSAVDLVKSARELLPKGEKRDQVDEKLAEAEQLLARSDAKLAHDLGYTMCKCMFPPTAMLFKRNSSAVFAGRSIGRYTGLMLGSGRRGSSGARSRVIVHGSPPQGDDAARPSGGTDG